MAKFYFTYGTEGHPFYGGWTVVSAENKDIAIQIFKLFHPCKIGDVINCSSIYTEEQFKNTKMWKKGDNFGHGCHEAILLERWLEQEK